MVKDVTQLRCQNCFGELDVKGQHSGIVRCDYCGTDNVLSQEIRRVRAEYTSSFMVTLRQALVKVVDYEGLATVCMDMNKYPSVSYHHFSIETLPGRSTPDKIRELIQWSVRHETMQELVDAVLVLYPRIEL